MSEVVERVSRAIDPDAWWAIDRGMIPPTLVESAKSGLLDRGRAAVQAMREPTEAMIDAGCKVTHVDGWELNTMASDLQSTWPVMIDAALK